MKNFDDKISMIIQQLQRNKLGSIRYKSGDEEIEITQSSMQMSNLINPNNNTQNFPNPPESQLETGQYVKSPIIGTFYGRPAPDKPPYVKKGETIKKGHIVCIIESMKIMHEISSPYDGKIIDVYPVDGLLVEFDANLFKIE